MANVGYLESLAQPTPPETRKALIGIVREGFGKLAFGAPGTTGAKATNFDGRLVSFMTASDADQEVAIAHGLARKPRLVIPALDPNTVNATTVDLTVTRAADSTYLYVSSAVTDASVLLYVE